MVDWLIVWCLTTFSTVFQLYCGGQCTYSCFPRILLTSTPHNILSKPLANFPHNHCRNKGQRREKNESCCNEYHQSSESCFNDSLTHYHTMPHFDAQKIYSCGKH